MTCVDDSPDGPEEFTDESARQMILRAMAALVAFVLCAGIALAVTRSDDSADDSAVVSTEAALTGTGTGPLAGTDVATYMEGRNRALQEARGRWVAVVSFRDYIAEEQFEARYESYDVKAKLVAALAGVPDVVTGSLDQWAARARDEAKEERRQLASMRETTDDKGFQDQFAADIERLGQFLDRLDPNEPVIFGMVVSASADELRALADRPEIRLVDIIGRRAPEQLDRLRGLRPEETVQAGEPRTRPA